MKKIFNKAAADEALNKYEIVLNRKVPTEGENAYVLAMREGRTFAAYVTGWATALGANKAGHFIFTSIGMPRKNGKPDVINGDTPSIQILGTRRLMRRLQAEFSPQIAAIAYVGEKNTTHNWQHPRSDAANKNNHPFSVEEDVFVNPVKIKAIVKKLGQ